MTLMKGGGGNGILGFQFRWRNDDGVETDPADGTWLAALNVDASIAFDSKFRLRYSMNRILDTTIELTFEMRYKRNGLASFFIIEPGALIENVISDVVGVDNHDDTTEYSTQQVWNDITDWAWADTTNELVVTDDPVGDAGPSDWPQLTGQDVGKSMSLEYCMKLNTSHIDFDGTNFVEIKPYQAGFVNFTEGWAFEPRLDFLYPAAGGHDYIPVANRARTVGRILTR